MGLAFVNIFRRALFIGGGIFCYAYVLPASHEGSDLLGYSSTDLGLIKRRSSASARGRAAGRKAFAIRPA